MTRVRTLAALVAILPLVAAQSATGAPPAPATSVSELAVTPGAVNPSDFSEAEYEALAANRPQTPHYSLEQMASFVCRTGLATTAYDATKRFEETKDAVRAGKTGMDALVRAEGARQATVLDLMARIGVPVRHIGEVGKTTANNLTIENVQFRFGNLGGESVIRLHGELRNSGPRPERVPIITASALDHFGIVLAQEGYGAPTGAGESDIVPAGGVHPFDVIFHDGPQYTHAVKLTFGPPVDARNTRTCDAIRPFKAPGQTLDVPRTEDAAQVALEDAASSPLRAETVSARAIKTDAGRVLRVTGSIRNTSPTDVMPSRLSIFIKDSDGHAIGEAESGLRGNVRGGDAAPFDLVVKDFHWLSAAHGQGSLDQMKTVSVLVE
jgi:hypothetical protein